MREVLTPYMNANVTLYASLLCWGARTCKRGLSERPADDPRTSLRCSPASSRY